MTRSFFFLPPPFSFFTAFIPNRFDPVNLFLSNFAGNESHQSRGPTKGQGRGEGRNVPPGAPTTVMSGPRRNFPQPLTCPYGRESLLMLRISKITFDRHNGRFALKWPFWHPSLKLQVYQSLRLVYISLIVKCQS